jgi:hypothetical protein
VQEAAFNAVTIVYGSVYGSGFADRGLLIRQDVAVEAVGGPELLVLLVMALGAALCLGNLAALTRTRRVRRKGELVRAPRGRSLLMAACGLLVFVWGLATLLTN